MITRRTWLRSGAAVALGAAAAAASQPAIAAPLRSVQLEDLSWTELRDAIAAGARTVLVPVGGTEQSGPHMALGKHNVRARVLSAEIARRLGNAVVAPVIAYVPEGNVSPPTSHMRFTGTITIPESTFESLLASTAASLRQHGFRDVVFLGDHGGYQRSLQRVADTLNRQWKADPRCRAHALLAYYDATQKAYVDALRRKGHSDAEIGEHAGLADTSLMMAVDKSLVLPEQFAAAAKGGRALGVNGDPTHSSAELGRLGVDAVIETSVNAIRSATGAARR